MIHTFLMKFPITDEDVNVAQIKFGTDYKHLNQYFQKVYGEYFNFALVPQITKGHGRWYLSLFVDAVALLQKSDITETDYREIKLNILECLILLFNHATHYDSHILARLDYRFDVTIENKQLRKLYFHLIKKHVEKYRHQIKCTGKKNASGEFEDFNTTVYHNSQSVVTTAYDKEAERFAKRCKLQPYEKDVIRFEVRLLYNHLYYKASKRCKTPIPMKLESYFKESVYYSYLKSYLLSIYPQGDYYKYAYAEKWIGYAPLKATDKALLKEFLKKSAYKSLSTAKRSYSKYVYNKMLNYLGDLNINPITIPKNYPQAPRHFKNPLNDLYTKFK
ncbi:hypothetical protein MKZ25_19400 [Solibacillus sp. FSL W7-1464]|uniref:hypothetical protein n=1 Tax=Solibacillus sp. FSL W7-1464 TaxID=2921706 RepID=UPI0030F989D4